MVYILLLLQVRCLLKILFVRSEWQKGIYFATILLSSYHYYIPLFLHVFYSLEVVHIALRVLNTADMSQLSKNTGTGKQETTFPLNFFEVEYCITLERHNREVFYITTYLILSLLLQCKGKGNSDFKELQAGQTQPHTHGDCLSKRQTVDCILVP